MPWDPEQYLKYQAERFAPFEDLLALIRRRPGLRAVDLGCGTGELTARLADALQAQVVGLDSSAEMLARARAHAREGLTFEHRRLEDLEGAWDLIFSHAALQWADDHARLIPRLYARLAPGGQLAVQIPANHDHFTHAAIRDLAREEPFRAALGGWVRETTVLPVERYAELLHDCGAEGIRARVEVYGHVLDGADALLEWTRGTTLLPYLDRLPEPLRGELLDRYRLRLRERFPGAPVYYPFKRVLFAATRP